MNEIQKVQQAEVIEVESPVMTIDEYSDYLRIARVNELQKIAQDLGAKYFKVTYLEEKKTLSSHSLKAQGKGILKKPGK